MKKIHEKLQATRATLETAAQNITALTRTTRTKALGIAAAASLAACSKDEPMPGPQPTTVANTITVLQNPPATVSGAGGRHPAVFPREIPGAKGRHCRERTRNPRPQQRHTHFAPRPPRQHQCGV